MSSHPFWLAATAVSVLRLLRADVHLRKVVFTLTWSCCTEWRSLLCDALHPVEAALGPD